MSRSDRVFVAAWSYPPIMSGESVVCRRTLDHSAYDYDICCGPVDTHGDDHMRLFPTSGDKYLYWPFAAAKQFEQLHAQKHYQVMMSRIMPPNGHLAGWLIKKHHPEVKWIAYFSDPIWNSPFIKLSLRNDGSHRPNWLLMKLFGIPSKWALWGADKLMFNNERLARYVLGKHYDQFKEKVLIVPYGHEGIIPCAVPKRGDGKLLLAHVGQIYGNRNLKALVEGVELLQKESPALFEKLSIRQVGFVCDKERQRVEHSPASSAFTLVGQVSYDESIKEMYAADWLLIIDPVFDESGKNIYIPGKIFDYMSVGRPILCIADKDSATGDVAVNSGMMLAAPNTESVAKALIRLLSGGNKTENQPTYARYSCLTGVAKMDKAIADLEECK